MEENKTISLYNMNKWITHTQNLPIVIPAPLTRSQPALRSLEAP